MKTHSRGRNVFVLAFVTLIAFTIAVHQEAAQATSQQTNQQQVVTEEGVSGQL